MDSTNGQVIVQLKNSLYRLKSERDDLANDVMEERNIIANMEQELNQIKRQQQMLGGQLRDKELAIQDYDRMIRESEQVLSKLVENSQRLLITLEGEANKLKNQKKFQ